jgi:MinD superfamily P-loop ATPase
MKEITILSGKGGAGKTTITGSIANLLSNTIITDCDVDASDLFLLLQPENIEHHAFPGGAKAIVNNNLCINCRKCINHCRFDALFYNSDNELKVNDYHCEGCGLCKNICPVNAISMVQEYSNHWFISNTRHGKMIHAKMKPGEENSGKLVSQLRSVAKETAINENAEFIVNDGPPGIGCSAIASVSGADLVVMVIEASISGFHDFKRAKELVESFNTPIVSIINKFDINLELTHTIEDYLKNNDIILLGKIPFDTIMKDATNNEKCVPEFAPEHPVTHTLKAISTRLTNENCYTVKQKNVKILKSDA